MPVKIYEVKISGVENPRSIFLHNPDEAVKMIINHLDEFGKRLPKESFLLTATYDLYMTGELEMMKQKQQNNG